MGAKNDFFICPDCGRETVKTGTSQKYCKTCSKRRQREQSNKASYLRLQQEKENNAIKKAGKQIEKRNHAALEEQKAHDAEIDARSKKQIQLQCRFCKYQLRQGTSCQNRCIGCDYISWKGHSTDKGNGVGDCRSFEPLTKETKAERTARRKRAISISEADKAQNTGEKMRDVNQL
jgi:hypothetical protein